MATILVLPLFLVLCIATPYLLYKIFEDKSSSITATTGKRVTKTQRILVIVNLLVCFYTMYFCLVATGMFPNLRIALGAGMADILIIIMTILAAIANIILLYVCLKTRAGTAMYALITGGLTIWVFLLHTSGPIGSCEFSGQYTQGIYYTVEDMRSTSHENSTDD